MSETLFTKLQVRHGFLASFYKLYRASRVMPTLLKHFVQEVICLKTRVKQSIKGSLFIDQWTALPLIILRYMKRMPV